MQEVGMKQAGPIVIWQDNQAAIQIAMNRGALAKKTSAMELRVMTIRNKVEDMKVVPIYLKPTEMIADIGTKALDYKLLAYPRGDCYADMQKEIQMANATIRGTGSRREPYR
jgi:hypothetical protein